MLKLSFGWISRLVTRCCLGELGPRRGRWTKDRRRVFMGVGRLTLLDLLGLKKHQKIGRREEKLFGVQNSRSASNSGARKLFAFLFEVLKEIHQQSHDQKSHTKEKQISPSRVTKSTFSTGQSTAALLAAA